MKPIIHFILAVVVLVSAAAAKELPNAPEPASSESSSMEAEPITPAANFTTARFETRIVDKKFLSLAVVSTGLTFADSYTTLFARENWLAHKQGVCNAEVESAYLYGTHPTVARTYAVASVKSGAGLLAAYYLRKHHSKMWSFPLIANSIIGTQGVAQNVMNCN